MLSSIAVMTSGKMGKKIGKQFFSGNTLVDGFGASGMLRQSNSVRSVTYKQGGEYAAQVGNSKAQRAVLVRKRYEVQVLLPDSSNDATATRHPVHRQW